MKHVMLDLETMSTRTHAAIIAIGAVKFNPVPSYEPGSLALTDTFYCNVDLSSCADVGLHIDGRTVMWWLQQSEAARKRLTDPVPIPIQQALIDFNAWYGLEKLPIWGNGSTFDDVVLRTAYLGTGIQLLFTYKEEMCYRTLRCRAPEIDYVPPVLPHDALEDARAQAVHLQKLFRHFNMKA